MVWSWLVLSRHYTAKRPLYFGGWPPFFDLRLTQWMRSPLMRPVKITVDTETLYKNCRNKRLSTGEGTRTRHTRKNPVDMFFSNVRSEIELVDELKPIIFLRFLERDYSPIT